MKVWSFVLTGVLAAGLVLSGMDAEAARRLGGGKSMGKQSSNVVQRDATPAAPAAPGNSMSQSAAAGKPAAAPAAAAAAPRKPWGAMLGGLAAGLGLAWLASSLGLGEAFGNILLMGLLAMAVMAAVAWFMRRRAATGAGMQSSPYAMAGAGAGHAAPSQSPMAYAPSPEPVQAPRPATNWGGASSSQSGSMIGAGLQSSAGVSPSTTWSIPADFDVPRFVDSAKHVFVALQAAWDKGNVGELQSMMTDGMLHEVRQQLAERDQHSGGASNHTHVAALQAQLLGIEDLGSEWLASVEFSGSIQEDPALPAEPFREVWNMAKSKNGNAGWLVAGIQTLH